MLLCLNPICKASCSALEHHQELEVVVDDVDEGRFEKGMLSALKLEKLATPGALSMQNIMISCTDVIWQEPWRNSKVYARLLKMSIILKKSSKIR